MTDFSSYTDSQNLTDGICDWCHVYSLKLKQIEDDGEPCDVCESCLQAEREELNGY